MRADEMISPSQKHDERMWQLMLRRLPAMVWTANRELDITSAGGEAIAAVVQPTRGLVGRGVGDCFGRLDAASQLLESHRKALRGETTVLETFWERKAYRVYVEPLLSVEGVIEGCIGLAVDVTPRQAGSTSGRPVVETSDGGGAADAALRDARRRLRRELRERRQAEQALRDVQERFLQLATTIDSALWIHEVANDRLIYLSPGYERMWGIAQEDALREPGRAIYRGVHADDLPRLDAAWQRQLAGESTVEEFRIVRPDGSMRWICARAFPIVDRMGIVQRIAGIAEDVTQRRFDEEVQRRNERLASIGSFSAGIAHEVNNPLGAAFLSTQAALRLLPRRSTRVKECLDHSLESIRRCTEVVRSLLRFCREEPSCHAKLDLREVVRLAEAATRRYANERGCRLRTLVGRRAARMGGNAVELEIVLVNLVRNAIEARAKQVTVAVAVDDCEIVLTVSDDGVGIPAADDGRMCDPFFTTRRHQGGTGLGLSIAYRIVQEHGGQLAFARRPAGGTVAAVTLPTIRIDD